MNTCHHLPGGCQEKAFKIFVSNKHSDSIGFGFEVESSTSQLPLIHCLSINFTVFIDLKGSACFFCTLRLIIRIFMITYHMFYSIIMTNGAVLRARAHCWCPCKLKTMEERVHSDNPSKSTKNACFKRHETCRIVVSSHVPTLKHGANQGYITHKQLFQLLHETSKQSFLGYISVFSFMF